MNKVNFIGWDIGGAHLKVASVNEEGEIEQAMQIATPLWQGIETLQDAILATLDKLPESKKKHAITMTGELADIFVDRISGVNKLVQVCSELLGNDIRFYVADIGFINTDSAKKEADKIASANWHATAAYVTSRINSGLFIDIGSTTTDIIPFSNNNIDVRGTDDQSRLCFDELVYTGVIRTALMSLTNTAPFKGEWQNIAAEHFANTADVYRILGYLAEDDDMHDTADGNDKSIASSIRRLARMLGTDAAHYEDKHWHVVAQYYKEVQLQLLTKSILRVLTTLNRKPEKIIGAGVGCFLVEEIAQRLGVPYQLFSSLCMDELSKAEKCNTCAPAVALAQLNRLSQ